MIPVFRFMVCVCVAACMLSGETPNAGVPTAAELSKRAGALARGGNAEQALPLYRAALSMEPENAKIRTDYATVLGWAERYPEAVEQFRMVIGTALQQQPDWVLQEFARAELFGNDARGALVTLDVLVHRNDRSEATLCRRALALRWLNRPKEAEQAYEEALRANPQSLTALVGTVYSLSDQNQLSRALTFINEAIRQNPGRWQLVNAKVQVLNWMGRHREALRLLSTIGAATGREVEESRIAAARWGGKPQEAKRDAEALAQEYPDNPAAEQLRRDVRLQYGEQVGASLRVTGDSDGVADRLFQQAFAMHAGAANRVEFAVEQRQVSMDQSTGWRRASLSWLSELSSRWAMYTSVNQVKYEGTAGPSKVFGDGSLTYMVSDRIRLSGGAGTAAVDAFLAIQSRVTSSFYYGEISAQPTAGSTLSARYAHTAFSDGVERNKADVESFLRIHTARRVRFDIGGSGDWMTHNRETVEFYSPTEFYSVLGKARLSGRLSRRVEYEAEIGAGVQRESVYALQTPLAASGTIIARINRGLAFQMDAGRSTSSLERINNGRESYSRFVLSAGLVYRFE